VGTPRNVIQTDTAGSDVGAALTLSGAPGCLTIYVTTLLHTSLYGSCYGATTMGPDITGDFVRILR
jgi:hypothetical protein